MMAETKSLEINVPDTLNSIKLSQYQKYLKILDANKDVEEDNHFLNRKFIEIFCDMSLKEVDYIELKVFSEITNILEVTFQETTPLIRHFSMNGVSFGFIPNLDKLSVGEYIDIEQNITSHDNLHKAMAVLFRPVKKQSGDKYQIVEYGGLDEYAEIMKSMPLGVALGARVFFWQLGKDLLNHILKSLEQEKEGMTSQQVQTLEANGVGISQFTSLLEEMSLSSKKLPDCPFINV
tara:strand:+ start:250 stop:954 length:705 start_codon:yes stop_codon:yes gene_type:complete